MILTYNDCKNKYGSQYNINKAIKNGELYQLEKGIYSDKSYEPELQIISTKYPNAVFTMNSAFYYHNLTDTIPEKYHLATSKSSAAISDKRVIQRYENSATLELGVIIKEIDSGVSIRIYNKERRCKRTSYQAGFRFRKMATDSRKNDCRRSGYIY